MAGYRIVSSLVVAGVLAASSSTSALANDHRSHGRHNNDGIAIVAGIIGAVVIGSILSNSQSAHVVHQTHPQPHQVYGQPQYYYEERPQPYYRSQPVRQVHYGSAPRYYEHNSDGHRRGQFRDRQLDRHDRQDRQRTYRAY